jgi:hypothetical protein
LEIKVKSLIAAAVLFGCSVASAADHRRLVDVWPGGGVFVQVVDGAEWKSSFYFHNMDAITIHGVVVFVDDKGDDMPLPFSSGTRAAHQFTLSPRSTISYESLSTGALKQGAAFVFTCDRPCLETGSQPVASRLGALAVFRWRQSGTQEVEAVVPMEMPDASAHVLFDNRQGYATGFAVMNAATSSDTISISIYDSAGALLNQDSVTLGSWEKRVFLVADRYPTSAGKQGCIVINGKAVVALGLRASPNGALSSSHSMAPMR